MGKLYEYSQQIQKHIEANNLDVFRTRGELAMRCGFIVTLIRPEDPDDPTKIESLREAAKAALGLDLR
jgi:hypothetical protein